MALRPSQELESGIYQKQKEKERLGSNFQAVSFPTTKVGIANVGHEKIKRNRNNSPKLAGCHFVVDANQNIKRENMKN